LGDPPATLGFWESNVGTLAQARGDLSGARQHMERALELLEPLGSHRPRIISVLSALVSIYHDLGERTRAKALAGRAASLAESVYGADHPEFAETLKSLAQVRSSEGHYQEALDLLSRARAILERAHGARSGPVAAVLNDLAAEYLALGNREKSRSL